LIGDTTKRVVMTDIKELPWERSFDEVIPWTPTAGSAYMAKLLGLSKTSADQILFIDSDCLVFRRLGPIFDYCAGKDLCVQGHTISGGEWYGDVVGHCARHDISSMPKFNGGMIYYERSERTTELIRTAYDLEAASKTLGFDNPRAGEEPILSLAMAKTGIGALCPMELDFMNSGTGLIGRMELDVRQNKCSFVCRGQTTRYVHPYIFHAWYYIGFLRYWRQLDILERLEKYETTHGPGHMPWTHRMRKSAERRLVRLLRLDK
jgi:hypothetical protein